MELRGRAPAFYFSECWAGSAPTRAETIAQCEQAKAERLLREPTLRDDCACETAVHPAYGPFRRKPCHVGFDSSETYTYIDDRSLWVDDTGQNICIAVGTAVATPDGARPIEAIAPGDAVVSWSSDDGHLVMARVTAVKRHAARAVLRLRLDSGGSLRATGNHLVRGDAGWTRVDRLRLGDGIVTVVDGRAARATITNVIAEPDAVDVLDLIVEPTHSYVADGVVVHNY